MGNRQIQIVRIKGSIPALRKNKRAAVLSVTELDSVYMSAEIHVCCNLQAFLLHLNDAKLSKTWKNIHVCHQKQRDKSKPICTVKHSLCSTVLWRPSDFLDQTRLL